MNVTEGALAIRQLPTRRTEEEALESILSQLETLAAASTGADLERSVQAMIQLAPLRAAEWMVLSGDLLLKELSRSAVGHLLETLAERARRSSAILPHRLWERVLEVLESAVTPAILVVAARSIPKTEWDQTLGRVLPGVLRQNPAHPGLLRLAVESAIAAGTAEQVEALLTRLGRADPSPGTVGYVHRSRSLLPAPESVAVRTAILSSFTADPLVPYLDLECRALGLTPHIYLAPFNTWEREVFSAETGLGRFGPEITFLAVSIDDLVPSLASSVTLPELEQAGEEAVSRVLDTAARLTSWSRGILVVHSFYSAFSDPAPVLRARYGTSRAEWVAGLNSKLAAGLRDLPRAYLLNMSEVIQRRDGGGFDNPKLRHMASMRLAESLVPEVAAAYARFVAPAKGLTRKCVVVDLDNTLWGGVIGEDGARGIRLGSGSPGAEYVEFQNALKTLSERGILLAIASKNNLDDAMSVIREHPAMVLREQDFSATRINWLLKPDNLRSMAEELGIGLDSMVFLDDNPNERELMRRALPQVLTPELPTDPAQYRRLLESLPQLQVLEQTEEDRTRVEQYRARSQRESLRSSATSVQEFLQELAIEVQIGRVSESSLPRVHQLIQRTNQFNLTTRRYSQGELAAMTTDSTWRLFIARARDRYSDHGLVAAAFARVEQGADGTRWLLDSFLMSCRVIGYGVETALLSAVSQSARNEGAVELIGEYIETPKNPPARDFLSRHDFEALGSENPANVWKFDLARGATASPEWVRVTHGA